VRQASVPLIASLVGLSVQRAPSRGRQDPEERQDRCGGGIIWHLHSRTCGWTCALPRVAAREEAEHHCCRLGTSGARGQHSRGCPNAFGLYDMHGNVLQWVEDCYHKNYEGAPADGSAWTGNCNLRILRGGSWFEYPVDLRSSNRAPFNSEVRISSHGFRVGRTLTP